MLHFNMLLQGSLFSIALITLTTLIPHTFMLGLDVILQYFQGLSLVHTLVALVAPAFVVKLNVPSKIGRTYSGERTFLAPKSLSLMIPLNVLLKVIFGFPSVVALVAEEDGIISLHYLLGFLILVGYLQNSNHSWFDFHSLVQWLIFRF